MTPTTKSKSRGQKGNIECIEDGILITFKDKTTVFIRLKLRDREGGFESPT